MPEPTVAILRRARGYIERGWCQRTLARSACSPTGDKAVAWWCLIGALRAAGDDNLDALGSLERATGYCATAWNDVPGRTKAEVLAVLDAAIAAEEAAP